MDFPEPVIRIAIEPKTKADIDKLGVGLQKLAEEDPTFKVATDDETGQTLIAGMGELHLEIIVDRLKREFKVEANVGAPQVSYREAIRKGVDHSYTHKKQSGGRGQFAHVDIEFSPMEDGGTGLEFIDEIKGGAIPREFIASVQKGIESALDQGPIAGYPIEGIKARLYDGKFHNVDSDQLSFEIAGRMAFREATRRASPVIMEPIMKVEVITPEEYMGDVIGDPLQPPRPDRRDGPAQRRPGHRRDGAALGDVRVLDRLAEQHPGPGHLLDAVRPLPGGPEGDCRRDRERGARPSPSPPGWRAPPAGHTRRQPLTPQTL